MVTSQSANEVFLELKNDSLNRVCIDCGEGEATFASISYGCFICQRCSEAHQNLGKSISFVKSLSSEGWSFKQLKLMTVGGNSELRAFFEIYSMPCRAPQEYKYNTVAAKYYRERLLALANDVRYEVPQPTPEEGLQMVKYPAHEPEASSGISGLFYSALDSVKSAGKSLVTKAQEIQQDPRFKELEDSTVSALKSASTDVQSGVDWTKEKGRVITDNPTFQSAASSAKSTTSSAANAMGEMASSTSQTIASDPDVKEISQSAKLKLNELDSKARQEASSFYSSIAGPSEERPNTPPEYR